MDGVPKAMTEYEAERARRIAENKAKMSQMGLADASRALTHVVATQARGEQRAPRLRGPRTAASKPPPGPPRASKRLRGCNAPEVDASKEEPRIEGGSNTVTEGKRKEKLTLDPNTAYAAPFTLASIGTTVWELGAIHRGPWAQRYWSSSQCLFHHAYPVGYRATKVAFGSTYEMRIEAGEQGPVFSVTNMDTGARFEGTSPTKPWTSVCISHRTGQRISGPLYFG